mmetsp:Transcript_6549/g.20616  ORF Transcript_6549/g.20616 Transcript_6549/m.20616 type:complete len:272 (-) Transcript_6549:98-913(-)
MLVLGNLDLVRVERVHLDAVGAEEPLDEDLRELPVLVLVEPRVLEDVRRAENAQSAARARLVQRTDRPVERVRDVPAGEDGEGGLLHCEARAVRVGERQIGVGPRLRDGRGERANRRVLTEPLARADVNPAVQDAVRDVHLLGVKVLVIDGAHDRVGVHLDPVLLEEAVEVGAEARLAALGEQKHERAALRDVRAHGLKLLGREAFLRRDKDVARRLPQPVKRDRVLVDEDLNEALQLAPPLLEPRLRRVRLALRAVKADALGQLGHAAKS